MTHNQTLSAYSIKEVARKINIPPGTIRQWEKDLSGLLVIPRTKQGARYYTEVEINLLLKIKEMRDKNVSKDMIREMFTKYMNMGSNPPSESFEIVPQDSKHPEKIESSEFDKFYTAMENYKGELITEIKNEMIHNRQEMIMELKNELKTVSLETVKEVSKSIQRSTDKRQAEVQLISNSIEEVSKQTSELFGTLSKDVTKSSETTSEMLGTLYQEVEKHSEHTSELIGTVNDQITKTSIDTLDQLSKRIVHSSRVAATDQRVEYNKLAKTVISTKRNMENEMQSIELKQKKY